MFGQQVNIALFVFFFFQAEDGIRDLTVTGVQTCALPIFLRRALPAARQSTAHPFPIYEMGSWHPPVGHVGKRAPGRKGRRSCRHNADVMHVPLLLRKLSPTRVALEDSPPEFAAEARQRLVSPPRSWYFRYTAARREAFRKAKLRRSKYHSGGPPLHPELPPDTYKAPCLHLWPARNQSLRR